MALLIKKFLHSIRLLGRRGKYKRLLPHEETPRPLPPDEKRPWSLLLELPLDILVDIVPYLPLVSQVCLALICKPLYRLLRPVLDDEQLAWPRYLASPLTLSNEFGSELHLPRIDLLLKLEDARWLYCRTCLKLHPYNYFPPDFARIPPSRRDCRLYCGIVDLCSCLALTYTNGQRLSEWIQTGVPSQDLHRNIRQQSQCQTLNNRRLLIHSCSVTSQPDVFLALTIMLTLDAGKCLVVTTRYNVYWSTPHKRLGDLVNDREAYRPPFNTESIFLCSDVHALAGLYGSYAPTLTRKDACGSCDTTFHLLLCTDDGLHSVIRSERNLGIVEHDPNMPRRLVRGSQKWWLTSRDPGNAMEGMWYRWS
ncbi:uncharacterized protein APUU_61327A [Aspergillus puulaauensis]|uniref:F-box domain-containing protein n=1 Tax=Aspergillus puulaauensis TaxID=1220207 RepID=A0A7R7XVJ8_9EURO|nr:uncharacterized protein APUU_61327A [Aspergillus puulaauensis]BCS28279.1 hypothetical protein APUU_61327A [Aspergillus puulaauensis]